MSRIILKISGEALKEDNDIVAKCKLDIILNTIKLLKDKHQIGVVIGGGNFFRGREYGSFNSGYHWNVRHCDECFIS